MREASNSGASTIIPLAYDWGGSLTALGWRIGIDIMARSYMMSWAWGGMTMALGGMILWWLGLYLWIRWRRVFII